MDILCFVSSFLAFCRSGLPLLSLALLLSRSCLSLLCLLLWLLSLLLLLSPSPSLARRSLPLVPLLRGTTSSPAAR